MKILSFDSTARAASVAVSDDDRILAEYSVDNGLTQSELLLPMAEAVLSALKLSFSDIELYAVSTGPGSFTGVRIGAALVKGLAFDKSLPCVSVSTLEALAENLSGLSGILLPCMDARRGQVYNAVFSSDGENIKRLTPDRAISLPELKEELIAYGDTDIYVSGDGYEVAKNALSRLGVKLCNTPSLLISENAASVARVAYRKYKKGEFLTDSEIQPTYLRLPQAERERLERLNQKKD